MTQTDAGYATYYANHAKKYRFPWSLYHAPLLHRVECILAAAEAAHPGRRLSCLNVGSGPFAEYERLSERARSHAWFASDCDARAIDEITRRTGGTVQAAVAMGADVPFPGPFDVIVCMEVIEHLPTHADGATLINGIVQRLTPSGAALVTTPNYAWWSTLGILEATALEWAARRQGFTRAGIHPSRYTPALLAQACGAHPHRVSTTSMGWVCTAVVSQL